MVAVADLNGDERPDVVGTMWPTGVVVLLNRGDGTLAPKRRYALDGCVNADITCGELDVLDMNGDRRPDLVAASGWNGNAVYVQLNGGNGTFGQRVGYRSDSRPTAFAVADLNHDGRRDLITANYGSKSVGVLLNKPGLCNVQDARRLTLAAARRTLARVSCRIGEIRLADSKQVKEGV
jgi:FG-GAP-like repeat